MTRGASVILGAGGLIITTLGAVWIGSRRQQSALSAQLGRVRQAGTARAATAGTGFDSLETVPAPVSRYLRLVLRSTDDIQEVRLRQVGTLRADLGSDRWMPFVAEHIVVPPATGFVWNARVQIAPLLHVRVVDSLIEGRGAGQVSLLSALTVSAAADTPEMNSGSLHRYLAEAVWYPSALLPGPNLQWDAIDESRALATLTNRGTSVSLEFRFAETGEVTGIYTPARWGTFAGGHRQAPWEGHFQAYSERNGVLVPGAGDVGWYVDNEWQAVWKGRINAYQVRTGP